MQRGFFSSLFDLSFTSFVTTKIIKVIYVLTLIMIGLVALAFVGGAFQASAALGLFVLVVGAPIAALIYIIYARVILELIIQVFRISELLRDQNSLQRAAFSAAGWLPGEAAPTVPPMTAPVSVPAPAPAPAPVPVPVAAAVTPDACPRCGTATAPGAQFCRSCGQKLG
jgi:ribosomal protein L40E